jgi:tRNA-dihydrouridine synthase
MNFWKELPKPFTVLAPMEDVTDVVFRQIISECGRPDLFFTEFTSADGMFSPGADKVKQRLVKRDEDHPIVAQIWGKKPENYYKAAKEIVELGFDGVDINMGCPVKKIVKQGVCSALIDNLVLAKEVIDATKEGAEGKISVSVKTRIGFKNKKTEEWADFLLDQNLDALTIHGRVAKDQSKYPADWDEVAKVVVLRDEKNLDTVIIGNGDVLNLEDVYAKHEKYGVDGVMIGRGVFQDPFVFNPDRSINDLSITQKLQLLLRHAKLFNDTWKDTQNFAVMKRFFKIYVSGFDNASEVRDDLMQCDTYEQVEKVINTFINRLN